LKSYNTIDKQGLTAQYNAYAEIINPTIKEEYLRQWSIDVCKIKESSS
jgi:hypothetical protein